MKLPKLPIKRFFVKDPEILFKKIFCPICGEPTGNKSRCFDKIPEDVPPSKRNVVNKKLGILPIFSPSCIYRQDNLWEINLNYPASTLLIKKIKNIAGIERIFAVKSHTLQIAIANLFDEREVKQQVSIIYKTFIKEMQAIESNLYGSLISKDESKKYMGILFPNGYEWKLNGEIKRDELIKQSDIIENLLENLPNSKGIVIDGLEKGLRKPYTSEKENKNGNDSI